MFRTLLTGIILILGISILIYLFSKNMQTKKISIDGKEITVELADTAAKRTKGLMFRESLEENSGMLFIFPNTARHTFWMANTYIPLDILWIDQEKNVVYIEENVPPCTEAKSIKEKCATYSPDKSAKYVLEINTGKIKEWNIKIGSKVEFLD